MQNFNSRDKELIKKIMEKIHETEKFMEEIKSKIKYHE